jgi:hypothetical protein
VVQISIVQNRWDLLDWLIENVGGQIVPGTKYKHRVYTKSWRIQQQSAMRLLKLVQPYVKTARRQNQIKYLVEKWNPKRGYPTPEYATMMNEFERGWKNIRRSA